MMYHCREIHKSKTNNNAVYKVMDTITNDIGKRLRQEIFAPYTPRPVNNIKTSAIGVNALAEREGFKKETYNDTAKNPTIGYGHKLRAGESFPNDTDGFKGRLSAENYISITSSAPRTTATRDLFLLFYSLISNT